MRGLIRVQNPGGAVRSILIAASREKLVDRLAQALAQPFEGERGEAALKIVYEESRFRITAALSAREAKKRLKEESFDLLFFDLALSEDRGKEFLPFWKREGKGSPVIILAQEKDRERILQYGGLNLIFWYILRNHPRESRVLALRALREKDLDDEVKRNKKMFLALTRPKKED